MEIQSVESFLKYYDSIRKRTLRVVDLVPDDLMEWRYAEGKFSFGDLIRHLASFERYVFAENVAGRPSSYPGHSTDLAGTAHDVRQYFSRCRSESLEIFMSLSDADLSRRCETPGGAVLSTAKWLRAMIEHEVHHRRQLYLMLAMVGRSTPPIFGLTSEQVFSRARDSVSNIPGR